MAIDDDPDALARELNEMVPAEEAPEAPPEFPRLDAWLRRLVQRHGSDLLLVAGAPAAVRIDGRVQPLDQDLLDGDDIEQAVLPALPPHARRQYEQVRIADT